MNKKIEFLVRHHGEGDPTAAVIWLHGLGADGYDFANTIPMLQLSPTFSVHFCFPHAPLRPVTINGGIPTPAWYDILDIGERVAQDYTGISAMMPKIHHLIDEATIITNNSRRVFVVGFSQGGAMALHAGLRYPQPLGGIVGLSTYLPVADTLAAEAQKANKNTPIFLAHGSADPIVPHHFGEYSHGVLQDQGYQVTWHSYPIVHSICEEEFKTLGQWLTTQLQQTSTT